MEINDRQSIDPAISRPDLWPLIGIILLVLALYHPLLLNRPVMPDTWERFEPWNSEMDYDGPLDRRIENANNDAILLYIPWNKLAHDELSDGRIPAWDPYCLCGVPLVSNHLVPVFYPVYWLIARFFAPLFIMGLSGLIHTLIMAFFFYLFIREWLGNRIAAWIVASFLVVSLLPNPHYQPWPMTIAWFPAIWFFYERWLKHRSPWAGLWMALCWAGPLLAGYPSLFIQLSLFTAVWFLIRPAMMTVIDRPDFLSRVWIFVLPFVLAMGLSAVQNLPTVMASMESERSVFKTSDELAKEAAFTIPTTQPWQIHAKRLLQPILPIRFEKNDFFNRGHVGVLPVLFALFGLGFVKRKKYPKLVLLLALIIAPFALIPALNFWVYWLTMGALIDPNPPLEVFGFLLLMLSAAGVKCWLEAPNADEQGNVGVVKGSIVAITAAVLVIAASIFIDIESFVPGISVSGGAATGLIIFSFVFLKGFHDKGYIKYSLILISLLLSVNAIWSASLYYSPKQGLDGKPMPETPTITALLELTDPELGGEWGRIIRYSNNPVNVMSLTDQPYTFYPNLGTYFSIPDAFGYHNLAPESRFNYLRFIQKDAVIERRGIVAFSPPYVLCNQYGVFNCQRELNNLGVKYILSDSPIDGLAPLRSADGFFIYKIDDDPDPIAVRIGSRITLKSSTGDNSDGLTIQSPSILMERPGRIICEVNMPRAGSLTFNEAYSLGWEVLVDGERAEGFITNSLFMNVAVCEGFHTIEFRYIMPGLTAGCTITGLSLMIWLLTGLGVLRRRNS